MFLGKERKTWRRTGLGRRRGSGQSRCHALRGSASPTKLTGARVRTTRIAIVHGRFPLSKSDGACLGNLILVTVNGSIGVQIVDDVRTLFTTPSIVRSTQHTSWRSVAAQPTNLCVRLVSGTSACGRLQQGEWAQGPLAREERALNGTQHEHHEILGCNDRILAALSHFVSMPSCVLSVGEWSEG